MSDTQIWISLCIVPAEWLATKPQVTLKIPSLFDVCIIGTISLWGSMPLSQDVTLVIKQNDRRVQGWNPTGESSHIAPRSSLTSKIITFALTQVYSVERSSSTKPVAFEYKSWSAVLFGRAC